MASQLTKGERVQAVLTGAGVGGLITLGLREPGVLPLATALSVKAFVISELMLRGRLEKRKVKGKNNL